MNISEKIDMALLDMKHIQATDCILDSCNYQEYEEVPDNKEVIKRRDISGRVGTLHLNYYIL